MKMVIEEKGERKIYRLTFSVRKDEIANAYQRSGEGAYIIKNEMARHNMERLEGKIALNMGG